MNAITPVEQAAEVLGAADYRRLSAPLKLAGIEFDFSGVFVGTGKSSDLILIADTAFENERRIQQKVEGVARALDVVGSQRPLTVVLTGPRPSGEVIAAMSRFCRVLPVGSSDSTHQVDDLHNWLAVLLPLNLPQLGDSSVNVMTELADESAADPISRALVDASQLGTDEVERCLSALVSRPLDDLVKGNGQ